MNFKEDIRDKVEHLPRMNGVYGIKNVGNGKVYVGQANRKDGGIQARCASHVRELDRGKHKNKHLQAAWKTWGRDQFIIEVLFSTPGSPEEVKETIDKEEARWIQELRTFDRESGYNTERFARGTGPRNGDWIPTMGDKLRGRIWMTHPETGENKNLEKTQETEYLQMGWKRGQTISEDGLARRIKASQRTNTGKIWMWNPETREDKKVTPEDKPLLEESGWVLGRGKMLGKVSWNKGIPNSPEKREKISKAGKGRVQPREEVEKRKASLRKHLDSEAGAKSRAAQGEKFRNLIWVISPDGSGRRVSPEVRDQLLSLGWSLGKPPKKSETK